MQAYVRGVFCLVIVAVISTAAFAVDGIVLINQASVMAAGGFPYKITQSGSYKLSGNLTVPDANTSGINVLADNVTLDLNGFSIVGPITCSGTPLACSSSGNGIGILSSADNIAVRNGSIIGMGGHGILLTGSRSLVEDIRAKFNSSVGIWLVEGTVRRCDSSQNGFSGMQSVSGVLEGSTARGNGVYGLIGLHSTIIGNTSLNNQIGLWTSHSVYGSNSLQNNATDVLDVGGSVTQNNNICSNGGC